MKFRPSPSEKIVLAAACFLAVAASVTNATENLTLSIVPVGSTIVSGRQLVTFEVFITADAKDQRLRGSQVDLPCSLPGGTAGTVTSGNEGTPGPDPDPASTLVIHTGTGSSQGIPFLFPGGLSPVNQSFCRAAGTVSVGGPPLTLAAGQTRYLATAVYRVSECAAGTFDVFFESVNSPPTISDQTRLLAPDGPDPDAIDDPVPFKRTRSSVFVSTGQCCLAADCLGDLNATCCQNQGGTFDEERNCSTHGCPCAGDEECDDKNVCTLDVCQDNVCGNFPDPAAGECDDGRFCTADDRCNDGRCEGDGDPCPAGQVCDEATQQCVGCLADQDCDDQNPCTTENCLDNECFFEFNDNVCDDGLFCTVNDRCAGGVCLGPPRTCPRGLFCDENVDRCTCLADDDCDDGNDCTLNVCVQGVCEHPVDPAGPRCDDGLFCTSLDACDGADCVGFGQPCAPELFCDETFNRCVQCFVNADCDDKDICTNDVCNNGTCINFNNTALCDDGLFCTINDRCSGGQCGGMPRGCPVGLSCDELFDRCAQCTAQVACDDGNACTLDFCDDGDCRIEPDPAAVDCDDGLFCTENDRCFGVLCMGTPLDCPAHLVCAVQGDACECPPGTPCGTTHRVSIGSEGEEAEDISHNAVLSADGRYVAFSSYATHLVSGTSRTVPIVVVHDRFLRQTTRVSVAADGQIANAGSGHPSMSADGRLIAFQSLASNLVPSDFNGREDCFVHSLATGVTTRISVTSAGESGNSGSRNPAISADGRIVAFQSDATNFAAGDVNQGSDVFVHDRTRSQTTRISMSVNGWSAEPALSADGRYVAFESGGSDLVLGDLNGTYDVFVHDRQNQLTARVSVNSAGLEGNGRSGKPAISADGRFVVFESEAHNLVLGDTNGRVDVFVHDRQTRRTVRVSVDSFGREGPHASRNPTISPDGRYVAFQSFSSLVAGSGGAAGAVYLHDRTTGFTSLMAIDTSGQAANAPCDKPALSVEARFIAFQTAASNLVEADTNDALDVFVHQRLLVCGFGGFDPAYECDDGNPCTADLCMDHLCRNEPNSVACNDERFCTVFDSCAAGTCQGLFLRCNDPELPVCDEELQRCVQCLEDSDCDDDNVCTNDQCDLKSSTCQFTPNSKNCNDGLFCTKPDFCLAGECIGVPRRCPNGQTCDEQSAQCIPR